MKKILVIFFYLGLQTVYAQQELQCTENGCNFTQVYNSIEHCQYLNGSAFNPAQLNALIVGKMDNVYMFSINKNQQSMSIMAKLNDFISHKDIIVNIDIDFSKPFGSADYMYTEYHRKSGQFLMNSHYTFALNELGVLSLDEKNSYQYNRPQSSDQVSEVDASLALGLNRIEFGIQSVQSNFQDTMTTMEIFTKQEKNFYYNLAHCSEGLLNSIKKGLI